MLPAQRHSKIYQLDISIPCLVNRLFHFLRHYKHLIGYNSTLKHYYKQNYFHIFVLFESNPMSTVYQMKK
jgi:hypothetical protein